MIKLFSSNSCPAECSFFVMRTVASGAIKAYARKPSAATLDAASDAMNAYFLMINEDGDLLRDEVDAIASRMNMDMDVEQDLLDAMEAVISR